MEIKEPTKQNIDFAVKLLRAGNLVAFPTETVYGLGADGLNEIAVSKIFEVKKRPQFNPLILHISSLDMLKEIAWFNNDFHNLTEKFWPGPLTLVLKKKKVVPYIVTSGLDTVAVRIPDNKIALQLIEKLGRPIAAPSANMFKKLSPTKAEHVAKQLGNNVKLILDGGNCKIGVESTIIEIKNNKKYYLRPGGVSKEDIEKEIGKLLQKDELKHKPNSPGQLPIHYAPNTPIYFYDEKKIKEFSQKKIGVIFFSKATNQKLFSEFRILSKTKNLYEAASNLFKFLHELEDKNLDAILVEKISSGGLGEAIMDRLTKAVNKYKNSN
ncbi:MAG: threonylcarbamoyl-AMP synthase [Ignavibacteriae bacterium]|nr:MAG: threonylcarbamoyl-AMP synthase [Ignavibacteriota bacterium]